MAAVLVVLIFGVAIWIVVAGANTRAERDEVLEQLARELGGHATSSSAHGAVGGVAVHLEYTTRGAGSSSTSWTYVTCALPPGYPLVLHLDGHGWFDAEKIERGDMVDVVVGDPPFDDKFRVEGAPAEVVKRLLTPEVRGYLLGQDRVEVDTQDDGTLRLCVLGWLQELEAARSAIACATAIAGSLRTVTLALDGEVPIVDSTSPYRGIPDDAPLQEARAARAAEVARVKETRATRIAGQRALFFAVAIVVGLITFAMLAGGP